MFCRAQRARDSSPNRQIWWFPSPLTLPHFVLSNHLQRQHTDLRGRVDPGRLGVCGGTGVGGGGLSILILFWDHYCHHLPGVSEADALAHPPNWPQRPSGHRDTVTGDGRGIFLVGGGVGGVLPAPPLRVISSPGLRPVDEAHGRRLETAKTRPA